MELQFPDWFFGGATVGLGLAGVSVLPVVSEGEGEGEGESPLSVFKLFEPEALEASLETGGPGNL